MRHSSSGRRGARAALFTLVLSLTSLGVAQTARDFSGQWVLESARPARPGFDAFWLGNEALVTQGTGTLTISRVSPPPERKAVFLLDRSESENVYTIDGVRHVKSSRTTLGVNLLISTDTTTPDGRRWLSHINRWSLDADGALLVTETEICGTGECPSIVTNLRFKKKTD